MINKVQERVDAIRLRREGKSYSEILEKVPVAKSTLALWLHEVHLAKYQKQRITKKRLDAARRGGKRKKELRMLQTKQILAQASAEIGKLSRRELWLIGVALYWAEGSKEKKEHPGEGVRFSNGDPRMIIYFLRWLQEVCHVSRDAIGFEIYIHRKYIHRLDELRKYWGEVTGFSSKSFATVYLKKHSVKTIRKHADSLYYGQLRIKVIASSVLLRRIEGWISGILWV